MAIASILRRRACSVIAPLLGVLFVGYFSYHAVQGDRGLLSYLRLVQEIRKAEITRDLIQAERAVLEKHVRLLRYDALDPDMLDERARIMLNLGRPDEMVIILQRSEEQPTVITE